MHITTAANGLLKCVDICPSQFAYLRWKFVIGGEKMKLSTYAISTYLADDPENHILSILHTKFDRF